MSQHFVGVGPLVHIHLQALVQEVLEDDRQLVPVLDDRLAVGRDQVERPQWVLVQVGRLPFNHLYGHDAERPHVDLGPVVLPRDDLRGHPVGGPYHGRPLVLLRADLSAEPEVGQLDVAVHPQQDVVRLDVAVDHVALGHGVKYLSCTKDGMDLQQGGGGGGEKKKV